ncbi:MAG: PAC2 family protein [Nanoarchaeota archaeon]
MSFEIKQLSKPELNKPILIEGLPGIGNVGKIAADFIVDNLKAKKFIEITSNSFPHSVFVNEKNLIDLPKIELYYKKGKQDLIFLNGDVQPLNEESCYEFCNIILDIFSKHNGKEIITLGGIGMSKVPKHPLVYCTANNQNIIKKYKTPNLNPEIFGVVGPIIGVTGLLIGLASKRDTPAIALLAQTLGHPNYLGIKGAREIIKILNSKLKFKLDLSKLDKEISNIEKEIKEKQLKFVQPASIKKQDVEGETTYIG